VDLLQLHNLVDPDEWATALGPGGALEAAVEAREQGKLRFIGVTGHGVTVAAMHLRSLERFPFDSVLLPYNITMMRDRQYAADFNELAKVCEERNIAMQTIKGITLGPWGEKEHTTTTWYEPLQDQGEVDIAVDFVLARPNVFLNTASDVTLLPRILDAASRSSGAEPSAAQLDALVERAGMAPLFV
jgi:predicted aldo/keto reductase-like oxidoreductase